MAEPIRIWAPGASALDVVMGPQRVAAIAEPGGWWRGPVLAHGDDYLIAIDGGPPWPDPRSRWQPHGVHGASRVFRAQSPVLERAHGGRLRDAVIYELHVGTFTEEGTFAAAIGRLGHLAELGVTHVELMPIAQFSGAHGWGYDGVDLYAAHAPYGGPEGLLELVRACHRLDLGVIVDVVHNHVGPEGAYLIGQAPYLGDLATPWGKAVNLDGPGSDEVRRFLIDSALLWLRDFGVDGLRLDAVHALRDTSRRHFVAELVDAVRGLPRRALLIGEYDDHDPRAVSERAAGGWGLDAHWNDDFHHAVHALVTGETGGYYADFAARDAVIEVLERGYLLDGRHSPFRGAPHGRPYGALTRDRLVGYIQSHDQIGNRAGGERLHQLAGLPRAKLAAALLFVSPFVPMLFQGEEWAASTPFLYFAQHESAELRRAVREGRRAEHAAAGWLGEAPDPTDPRTRDASVLDWAESRGGDHADMLAWYRALIAARRAHPALRDPSPGTTRARWEGPVLIVDRGGIALACNLSEERAPSALTGDLVLGTAGASATELPALGCALVQTVHPIAP